MQSTIQFIQTNPDDYLQKILSGFGDELDKLRSEFQPKEPTEYLTRQQVKDLLDVDLSTIHNWTKRGKLKAYGIGNRVYFKRSEVEQALKPLTV